jgi:predicted metalloprotease
VSVKRRLPAVLALAAALFLAGCGLEPDSRSQTSAPDLPPIQNDLGPDGYTSVVHDSLRLLNEYWSRELADRNVEYEPPAALVSYWNRNQDKGCGGQPAGWSNAQYCQYTDTISWDGNWVYGDLYRQIGDASVAFLLAHEFAHLVQQRTGSINEFPLTIEVELNADCLAGAWLGAVDREVLPLSDVDFDALDLTSLILADAKGVPWTDPTAHGTAAERRRAVTLGGTGGIDACLNRLKPGFTP